SLTMSQELKPLQPGRYIISSKLVLPTENNVIGINEHLTSKSTLRPTDAKAPVVYIPRPFRNPSWTVSATDDGTYVLQLENNNAIAEDSLLFAEKEAKATWEIKKQHNDTQIPLDAYTIESASEPGNGWVLDTDKPDENTQISYGPLLYLPVEPKEYVSNALWFFIPDDAEPPVVIL
ncbi:hypothetical protein M378DRAFT_168954, partial [Amanita muscaria Koide BX008]